MAENKVTTYYKIDGVDKAIKDQQDLAEAVGEVNEEFEDGKKSSKGFFAGIRGKGVGAFKALKGAIAATGIGLLLTAFAQLVEWFKQSDTGAKILQGTTAALGAIWTQLQNVFFDVIALFKPLFEDPIQSIKNFGQSIVDNIIGRFNALFDTIGFLGTAIKKLFEGDFEGAIDSAKQATDSLLNGVIGLDDIVEGVTSTVTAFGEVATKVWNDTAEAVVAAVTASNNLIDAQNSLRKLNQDLLVENAELNQELETQQKIADDTTRSYDERKAALDRVNAANEKLADNAVKLAQQERDTLALQLELANTDEERREIKDALAEANAALIESETAAQIVRLESAQLNRELDQEELERKQELADKEIELTKERNKAIIEADQALEQAKFALAQGGLQALQALAGDNEKAQDILFAVEKGLAIAQVIVNAAKAKAANTAAAAGIVAQGAGTPPAIAAGAAYLAKANLATGLTAATSIASIAAATIQRYKQGGAAPPAVTSPGPGLNVGAANTGANAAAGAIDLGTGIEGDATITAIGQGGQAPIRAYVVATEVTDAQEANAQIENLATL